MDAGSTTIPASGSELVIIREDTPEVIRELQTYCGERGYDTQITLAPGCSTGSCALRYVLLIARQNAPAGAALVEQYFFEQYPELKQARQEQEKGNCPACGYPAGDMARECPDCGLALIVGI